MTVLEPGLSPVTTPVRACARESARNTLVTSAPFSITRGAASATGAGTSTRIKTSPPLTNSGRADTASMRRSPLADCAEGQAASPVTSTTPSASAFLMTAVLPDARKAELRADACERPKIRGETATL
jgi:hypothetical protein